MCPKPPLTPPCQGEDSTGSSPDKGRLGGVVVGYPLMENPGYIPSPFKRVGTGLRTHMHEMSLAESVLQIIEESAKSQHFSRVRSVTLEIGVLAAVEPDAMRFCFDSVTRGSIAEGARLEIIETPGEGRCTACGKTVVMQEQYGLCPECGSAYLQVTSGNRMRVKDIEVE